MRGMVEHMGMGPRFAYWLYAHSCIIGPQDLVLRPSSGLATNAKSATL